MGFAIPSNRLGLGYGGFLVVFDFDHLCDRGLENLVFDIREKYPLPIFSNPQRFEGRSARSRTRICGS